MNIQKTQASNFNSLKFLFYGESGVGKTRLASTFPNPIFLDFEQGLTSVQKDVDYVSPQTSQEVWDTLKELEHSSYDTIVVDSINALQSLLIFDTLKVYPYIKRPYDSLPSASDYGKILFEFQWVLVELIRMKKTLVLLAVNTNKQYEADVIQPSLVGKATASKVCAIMDIIGYMTKISTEEGIKYLTIFNLATHVTKDRTSLLPRVIEDCSAEKIFQYLERKKE